ncbi:MAG: NACHT domain-containing protein, partial [Ktedonobacteraceae bacterium]|nr:NACHT domain-containing protein [Ktedonobacteraceae bacterium]
CVFTGDPGAGKTTLLRYLTLKAANGQLHNLPDFPIYIELNHFASSGYHDLLDFISTRWDDRYGFPKGDARSCIEEHLKEGKALLLLDALDETVIGNSIDTAEHSYQRISDAITELAARYHQSAIVVTVRKASYLKHNRLSGFTELELVDFRPEDMDRFMDNWFLNSTEPGAPTSARDLKAKLSRNVRLQALAANPLLMTLLLSFTEIR